jgi:hypothetical protein
VDGLRNVPLRHAYVSSVPQKLAAFCRLIVPISMHILRETPRNQCGVELGKGRVELAVAGVEKSDGLG